MKLNDFIQARAPITETIDSDKFKQILKVFLPIAKKIIQLDKMPAIVLRKTIHDEEQPTMGHFNNETYSLELAIANRQPVDALRTLAHELVHAKQNRNHVNIDPTTGSPEENEANEIAGIVMREFNKAHPEFLKMQPVQEGGNSELPNLDDPSQKHVAQSIDLTKIDRDVMLPAIDELLLSVNTAFQQMFGKPLWSAEVMRDRKHTSGSTFHFLNPNIPSAEFVKYKPKVGDIDTMVDRVSKPEIEKFLQAIRNKPLGNFKLLNYDEETEKGRAQRLKKGEEDKRAQFITQWEIFKPVQFKGLQIDLELADFETNPETGNAQPTDWARFSHSSDWEDVKQNVKGVFHKYIIQSITAISNTEKHRVDVLKTKTKINRTTDNDIGFAVASGQGGGMSRKYEPYTDPETGDTQRDNLPLKRYIEPAQRKYEKNLGSQFELLFNRQPTPQDLKLYESFIGCIKLCNLYLNPQQRQIVANDFLDTLFALDAQMLVRDDPKSDATAKMSSVDYMAANLKDINSNEFVKKANQMVVAYAEDHYDLQAYKAQNPDEKRPRMAMRQAKAAGTFNRGINEADEPVVKSQLRKGMPHLKDLKSADFLDLLDELHQGNDQFQLKNIPLNVKVDGMGGRFGKNAEGRPFMGTSRTEPRYAGGFLKGNIARFRKRLLAKQKGIEDPKSIDDNDPELKSITDQEVLDFMGPESVAMSEKFDEQFNDYMVAIKIIDQQLGKEFLVNKQVTCEVLDINFAKETDEGKLVFVGIHYDKLPEGVKIAFVPFRVTDATTGEDLPDSADIVKQLTSLKQQGSVMFIDNSLTQKKALDVTAIVPPLKNIKQFKAMLDSKKRDQAAEVKAALEPVKLELEKAIINDPNIIGKDLLGKDYEGIVINSRLGPIKITSQEQRDVISAKNAAKVSARTERPRDNQNKTAVVAIGSFAGHAGHQELFKLTIDKANEVGGDPYLFMGNAVGKDDPIPIADKVKTWQMLYPQYSKNISAVTMEGGSIMQKVKHELINPLKGQPPRYDNIIIMVGEDQAKMNIAQALMKAVNKFQGYEHVKAELEVTPRSTGISFTNLRNALKTQTPEKAFAIWSKAFYNPDAGAKQLPAEWIEHLMDVSRKGMGIDINPEPKPQVPQKQPVEQPMAEETGPMDTPLRRFMIKQIARITGRKDLDQQDDNEIEDLFAKYVPGSEKKIEKFNHAMQEFSTLEYQDRMAGVGMGNYEVDEHLLPKSAFVGSKKNKINGKGMKRGDDPTPVKAGDLVGEDNKDSKMISPLHIHKLADKKGIAWDNDKSFMRMTKEITGKSHLDDLTQQELKAVYKHIKEKDIKEEAAGVGVIASKKQANDPRYSMSLTKDVRPDTMDKEMKAFFPTKAPKQDEKVEEKIKGVDGKACWDGYKYAGKEKKANGKYKDKCVKVGEGWEQQINDLVKVLEGKIPTINYGIGNTPGKLVKVGPKGQVPHAKLHLNVSNKEAKRLGLPHDVEENFANGKNPGRKGLSKRLHINTKGQSAAEIERRAKKATGEKKTMLHFAANMKKGHAKKK